MRDEAGRVKERRLRPGASGCRTWSPRGRSGPRTSTASCRAPVVLPPPRVMPVELLRRARGRADPGLLTVALPPAETGRSPTLVGARRRAQAVARPRGDRADHARARRGCRAARPREPSPRADRPDGAGGARRQHDDGSRRGGGRRAVGPGRRPTEPARRRGAHAAGTRSSPAPLPHRASFASVSRPADPAARRRATRRSPTCRPAGIVDGGSAPPSTLAETSTPIPTTASAACTSPTPRSRRCSGDASDRCSRSRRSGAERLLAGSRRRPTRQRPRARIRLRALARASASTPSTSSSCSSRSRPTSTRASSGSTATCTTTSRGAGRASASRSSCAARRSGATRSAPATRSAWGRWSPAASSWSRSPTGPS